MKGREIAHLVSHHSLASMEFGWAAQSFHSKSSTPIGETRRNAGVDRFQSLTYRSWYTSSYVFTKTSTRGRYPSTCCFWSHTTNTAIVGICRNRNFSFLWIEIVMAVFRIITDTVRNKTDHAKALICVVTDDNGTSFPFFHPSSAI